MYLHVINLVCCFFLIRIGKALARLYCGTDLLCLTWSETPYRGFLPTLHSIDVRINEPRREKTGFLHHAKTKTQISCAVTAQLISAFVFAIRIVQSIYNLNPKFQASSHLL